MTDALLSPQVGITMCGISGIGMIYSVKKIRENDLIEKKIPIMAVMGAFIFAAQMINFTIPITGSSGHISGGILLAVIVGSLPAFLTMSTVLIIQALFFADGGLLALGANIFNLGVVSCLIIYPLFVKPIFQNKITQKKITVASLIGAILSLQLGAFGIVLQTKISGITKLPFWNFVMLMQPIHLLIGIVEGIATAAILVYIYKMRPEIFGNTKKIQKSPKRLIISGIIITLITAGLLSLFASKNPDGLEWSIEKITGTSDFFVEGSQSQNIKKFQENTSPMPDYKLESLKNNDVSAKSLAGIIGVSLVFLLATLSGILISKVKKSKRKQEV